jgi:DNA ligase-1
MSGFTDEVYKRLTAECLELVIPSPPKYYRVSEGMTPAMWFKPVKVWEIRGADLTVSPIHTAARGLVHAERGISLRFPRFIRERADKSVDQCSTSEQVADMYHSQAATMQPRKGGR